MATSSNGVQDSLRCRYERKAAGALPLSPPPRVPDAYMHNATLSDDVIALQNEVAAARAVAAKASATWDTLRKERDFHRMHHKRVTQEKGRLIKEVRLCAALSDALVCLDCTLGCARRRVGLHRMHHKCVRQDA